MALQTITLQFPSLLYKQVNQRAAKKRRTACDEVIAVVENAFASEERADDDLLGVPLQIAEQVRQLTFLDDHHLLQAAQRIVPREKSERMQELIFKQQAEGLIELEQQEAKQLVMYANLVMLIRAEAAVLLQERGLDISQKGKSNTSKTALTPNPSTGVRLRRPNNRRGGHLSACSSPPSPIIGTPEASAVEGGWGGEGWVAVGFNFFRLAIWFAPATPGNLLNRHC